MRKAFAWILCAALAAGMLLCSGSAEEPAAETIPEAFDLRSVDTDGDGEGDRCYVTPVKQQSPFGTCWGFAAISAAETSILGSVLEHDPDAWKTLDLSEKQLVYFSHVALSDPDSPQNGEGIITGDVRKAGPIYNSGAPAFLATSTFAQGIGPSDENAAETGDLFRYSGKEKNIVRRYSMGAWRNYCYSEEDDWSIPEEYRFRRDYLLKESFLLPSPAQEDEDGGYRYDEDAVRQIKLQLLQKRGVSVGIRADVSSPDQDLQEEGLYLNTKTWAHYTWDDGDPNHVVALVGWDDHYPKENFVSGHQPPADGAWLVKNSWGSGEREFPDCGDMNWGIPVPLTDETGEPVTDEDGNPVTVGSGYFWLSYYDRSLESPESFVFEDAIAPENVDQHDYMQTTDIMVDESETPASMANVFTAEHSRILTGISCMTAEGNTRASYRVVLLCRDYETPEDGLAAASGEVSFPYGGYHKIALQEPVYIQKGQSYAVIVTVTGEDGQYMVNRSAAFALAGQRAVINERESYLFADGTWTDYRKVVFPEEEDPDTEDGGSGMTYDNFPIKGYSYSLAGDLSLHLSPADDELSPEPDGNQTTVRLMFKGTPGFEIDHPEIEWSLLNGSGEIAEIVPEKEGSRVRVTAKKEGDIWLGVRVKNAEDFGTTVLKIPVRSSVPYSASAEPPEIVYSGIPEAPDIEVRTESGNVLYEGDDYVLCFRNNEKCGFGAADILTDTEDPDSPEEPVLTVYFAILPQKAEIVSLDASGRALRAVLADQWESGMTGYEIEYRKAGSADWIREELTDGGTEWTLENPEAGEWEIRVRAYADAVREEDAPPERLYGEDSEPGTVSVR